MAAAIESNELSIGIRDFSSELYDQCAGSDSGNVIISPLSVAIAIGLLSQGADGNTFKEIQQGLHLNIDKNGIADQYHNLYGSIKKSGGNATFTIANQLYVQKGYQTKADFKDIAVNKFDSGIEHVDFSEAENAAKSINSFVEEKTNHKIMNIISPDSLKADMLLVLVNAVHFKGGWEIPFSKLSTSPGPFFTSEKDSVNVEFMHIKDDFNFAFLDDMDAVAVEMKYADSDLSFVGILPNSHTGLPSLEAKLKSYNLAELTSRLEDKEVDMKIPKFKIEYAVQLNDVLKNMGMGDMFSEKSNLKGILNTDQQLKVSEANHKAFIQIDEHGTEAAAATTIRLIPMSLKFYERRPVFHADHPFVFFIWDRTTGTQIFYGRCSKFD